MRNATLCTRPAPRGSAGPAAGPATGLATALAAAALLLSAAAGAATETTLYSFSSTAGTGRNADGTNPYGGLVPGSDGNFHGTASQAGPDGGGTGFVVTPAGVFSTWFTLSIACCGPRSPEGQLMQASDGNYYGTSFGGGDGSSVAGTVYQVTPGGAVSVIHSFDTLSDGYYPVSHLVQGSDGLLYGSTTEGGSPAGGGGTLFRLGLDGSGFTTLHALDPATEGGDPNAGLVQARNGNFYGSAASGGPSGGGTVFELTPAGALSVLHAFSVKGDAENQANGASPSGLILGRDGNLYGTTGSGGALGAGAFFKITPKGVLTALGYFGNGSSSL